MHPSIRRLSARALAAVALALMASPLVAGTAHAIDPLRGAIVADARLGMRAGDVERVTLDPARSYVVGAAWTVEDDHDDDRDDDHEGAGEAHDHAEDDVRVYARYLHRGEWTAWQILAADGQRGAVVGTEDRGGTEPAIVSNSTAVEVRVEAEHPPEGLTLVLYTPDDGRSEVVELARTAGAVRGHGLITVAMAESGGPARTVANAIAPSAVLPTRNPPIDPRDDIRRSALLELEQPEIHLRQEWLARPVAFWYDKATVQGAAVHHTAGTNDYSRGETAQLIRAIQDFHMDERGFWDIGYNFLIDRWGRVWEGRGGGITNTWHGAHSHSFNEFVTGVGMMGTFSDDTPPEAAVNGLVELLAWKLTLHGVSADGYVMHPSGTQPAIIGHRDVPEAITECPGQELYDMLPEIRRRVARAQELPTVRLETDVTGDGIANVLTVTDTGVTVESTGLLTDTLRAPYARAEVLGEVPPGYTAVAFGPSLADADFDLLVRHDVTGDLYRAPLLPDSSLGAIEHVGAVAAGTLLALPGDVNHDGNADLVVAHTEAGSVTVRAGDGEGGIGAQLPSGDLLGPLTAIAAAGDLNGDGDVDLVAMLASGTVRTLLSTGVGRFTPSDVIDGDWSQVDGLVATGDVDGDGVGDVIATSSWNGAARTLTGGGLGLTGDSIAWRPNAPTWSAPLGALSTAADTGLARIVAVSEAGQIVAAVPTVDAAQPTAPTLQVERLGVVQAAIVGDVDGNGYADIITLNELGGLLLHRSLGDGFDDAVLLIDPTDAEEIDANTIAPDVPIASFADYPGWTGYTSFTGAGDFDLDGVPDLLAVDDRGDAWVFRWSSSNPRVLQDRIRVASGLSDTRVFGVGSWRRGHIADLVAVTDGGTVVLIRGEGMTGTRRRTVVAAVGPEAAATVTPVGVLDGDTYGSIAWVDETGDWATAAAS